MIHPIFQKWNLANKRVFLRADLNVPIVNGKITSDFRLKSILPTLDFLVNHNASIVLATHIGRPKQHEPELSTKILLPWFKHYGYSIIFVQDITAIPQLPIIAKQIILIENLRFFSGEKNEDSFFAKQLARTAHYYINDAFGVIHNHDCSVTILPFEFPENRRSIGFLMEKELYTLDILKNNPPRPFLAILGGKKIEDKLPLIRHLLPKIDALALCPALCFTFLKTLEKPIGKSLVNNKMLNICKQMILEMKQYGISYFFPIDYQIAYNSIDKPFSIISATNFPENAIGISIGPKTVAFLIKEINRAKTIFLNCAMGFAEKPESRISTQELINAMAQSSAKTIIAGGDSVETALNTKNYQSIDHLSSGGGAALAYLSNDLLPGLIAFEEK